MRELTPLAAAFVVLLGLVVWREAGRDDDRSLVEEAALEPLATRPFTEADVARVEVTAPGGSAPAYTLEKKDKSWRAVSAFTAPASGANVTKLLGILAKAEGELRADDEAALEQFDLTRAKAVTVRALDASGKELVHVAVGRTSGSRGAFVRNLAEGADDAKALALTADLRGALGLPRTSAGAREPDEPKPGHFHEKEFPQLPLDDATRVELTAPGRRVAFTREKKEKSGDYGPWKLAEGGLDGALKAEGVDAAVRSLGGGLRAMELVDPAKKKELGLEAPAYRIAVTSADGTTRAAVGATDAEHDHFYVRLDAEQEVDVVYEASEYEFHRMFPQGMTLFELPKPLAPKEDAVRIVVERKGRDRIEIARPGTKPADDWTLAAPVYGLAPKQQSLRSLASGLSTLRVTDYVDAAPPAEEPEVRITWTPAGAADGATKSVAIHGPAPMGDGFVASFGEPARAYVIDESSKERAAPEPLSLFETKVLHGWTRDDVTAVRVRVEPSRWSIVRDGDAWAIESEGAKTPASTSAVDAWLDRALKVNVTGVLSGVADFESTTIVLERKEGAPKELGVSVTKDGKRVVVLEGVVLTVDDEKDLAPDRAALAEAPPADEPK